MKTRILAAACAAFLALGSIALAETSQQPGAAPVQLAQATSSTCTAATDPAIPLSVVLYGAVVLGASIAPLAAPPNFGGNMRGSCVGTPQYVWSSQPFLSAYPYTNAWWVFGPFPAQQYRGN